MYYIRTGISSVKTPHGTLLRFTTSSITKKQQWWTLDHWACPLNNSPKDSSRFKKQKVKKTEWNYNKTLWAPFYGWGLTTWRLEPHFEQVVYFITISSQKFLILILSTLEGWKAESTLEPPNGFDHETPGLGIQHLNH